VKVSEFIAKLDRLMPNTFGTEDKVDWINYVEEYVFTTIIKKLLKVEIPLKADVASYAMEGYKFDQIEAIHVDDVPYAKRAENNYIEYCISKSDSSVGIGGQAGVISNVFSCILIGKTGIAPPEGSAGSRNIISITDKIHPSIETLSDFVLVYTNWHHNTVADPKFVNADGFDFHLLSAAGFVSNGVWVTNAAVGFSPGIDFGPRE